MLLMAAVLLSCDVEDPGPLQETSREYAVIDFDQLEMGSGFHITVMEGPNFMVRAKGDRRNIQDLDVFKEGSTLRIRYDENANRRHETRIVIQMPVLKGFNFSGGSVSVIDGFESDDVLNAYVSGGSLAQLNAGYRKVNLVLSGGSKFRMHGLGDELEGDISGASVLSAFDFPVSTATLNFSGASSGKITVADQLTVTASGASTVVYRGSPSIEKDVSGESSVVKD